MDETSRGMIANQISGWVKKNVAFPEVELHGKCTKVVLRHLSVDGKPQGDVKAFPVRIEEGAEDELEPLLNEIANAAQADADSMGQGVQAYALYAHYAKDQNYVARLRFRVSGETEADHTLTPTEPATEKGLVAQAMRHLEAVMRTSFVSVGSTIQSQQQEIRRLSEANEAYGRQQIDLMVLMQDTLNDQNKRRIEERKAEADLAMKESVVNKLEALVPVIINRVAGSQIVPEEDRSFMLMASFLEKLTDEQQMQFMSTLTEAQKMVLAEVIAEYEKKKSKWLAKEKKPVFGKNNGLPPPSSSPKQLEASVDSSEETPSESPKIPMFMNLQERIDAASRISSDPQMQELEGKATDFTNRFKNLLTGKKDQ